MAGVIKIIGIPNVLRNLARSAKRAGRGAERGLIRGGEFIQRKSQQIVPIDKNILRPSARTRKISGSGFEADIVTSYKTDYAVYVHEDLNARHKSGKQAKYLEQPARQEKGTVVKIIRDEVRKG